MVLIQLSFDDSDDRRADSAGQNKQNGGGRRGGDNRFVTYYVFDLFDEHVEGGINRVAINAKGINV